MLEAGADPAGPCSSPGAGERLVPSVGLSHSPAGAVLPPSLSPQYSERRWKHSWAVEFDVSL